MVYLSMHLKKYPLMQIQDVLKLYLQGILGPSHIVYDKDKIRNNLNEEYQMVDKNYSYDLIEEISDEYIRVYIKPYFQKYKSFDKLIDAFIKSCNENIDVNEFIIEVKKLINNDNQEFILKYLKDGNYLISHSKIYKDNYHPHYLVINKKYKGEAIYEI